MISRKGAKAQIKKNKIENILPFFILPVVTEIDKKTVQLGLQDTRSGEIVDCCLYCSDKQIVVRDLKRFFNDYEQELKIHGVV